jgi:hypothetical protein
MDPVGTTREKSSTAMVPPGNSFLTESNSIMGKLSRVGFVRDYPSEPGPAEESTNGR